MILVGFVGRRQEIHERHGDAQYTLFKGLARDTSILRNEKKGWFEGAVNGCSPARVAPHVRSLPPKILGRVTLLSPSVHPGIQVFWCKHDVHPEYLFNQVSHKINLTKRLVARRDKRSFERWVYTHLLCDFCSMGIQSLGGQNLMR